MSWYRCVRRISTCPSSDAGSSGGGGNGNGNDNGRNQSLRSLLECSDQSIAMQTDAIDNATHVPEDHTCSNKTGRPHLCAMPTLDYYGGTVWLYENVTFMFPQRTWHWSARKYPATGAGGPESHMYAPAVIDVGLAASRDRGKSFTHLGSREPFITVGAAGGFASKMVWALPSPVVVGDQIWIFYAGHNVDHNGDTDAFSRTGGQQSGKRCASVCCVCVCVRVCVQVARSSAFDVLIWFLTRHCFCFVVARPNSRD